MTRRPTRKATKPNAKRNSILSRAKPVSKIDKPRSWVIYGRAGTGKTTLAGTFPGPILLLDVKDEGTDSVSDVKGLDVFEVESCDDLEEIFWELKDGSKYKTVVIDTITQLQQIRVEEVSESKGLKGNKSAGDWGTLTKQDWGSIASWLKKIITDFRSLDMEVVFLAQDRVFNAGEEESEDGMIDPEVGPRLSPSVMSHLCAAVHMVGNTFIREHVSMKKVNGKKVEVRKKEYGLRLGPNSWYITKIRKPKKVDLPGFISNPSYDDIIEIVTGE